MRSESMARVCSGGTGAWNMAVGEALALGHGSREHGSRADVVVRRACSGAWTRDSVVAHGQRLGGAAT